MKKQNKNLKVISPCFCVKQDIFDAIQKLSQVTGLSRNSIVEIALCEVDENDLSRKFCGVSTKSKDTEKNLFDF